jgi:hypothetical protein
MVERLTVPIDELRLVCSRLLDHLASAEGNEVQLEKDFFWAIPPEQLYNVDASPQDLTIGQLSESWKNLTNILGDDSPTNAFALVWLADVLRAIGQEIVR